MMHVELSTEENQLLQETLEHILHELEVEIHRTDSMEYKTMLHHRRDILKGLSEKIAQAGYVPTHV